jgi:hypothetical protein
VDFCLVGFSFFLFIPGSWVWTQSLHLQPLYQPFLVIFFFWDRVSQTICQGWLWTMIFLNSDSWAARIIGIATGAQLGFSFCSTRVWNQGLAFARQTFYHLSHAPSPFCFSYFSDRVSHFCPGPAWATFYLCFCVSCVPGIKGTHHHAQLLVEWSLSNFLPRRSSNCSLPKFYLLSNWDYGHKLPSPALCFFFLLFFVYVFFFLVVLGFELGASPGRHSTIWATPPAPISLGSLRQGLTM